MLGKQIRTTLMLCSIVFMSASATHATFSVLSQKWDSLKVFTQQSYQQLMANRYVKNVLEHPAGPSVPLKAWAISLLTSVPWIALSQSSKTSRCKNESENAFALGLGLLSLSLASSMHYEMVRETKYHTERDNEHIHYDHLNYPKIIARQSAFHGINYLFMPLVWQGMQQVRRSSCARYTVRSLAKGINTVSSHMYNDLLYPLGTELIVPTMKATLIPVITCLGEIGQGTWNVLTSTSSICMQHPQLSIGALTLGALYYAATHNQNRHNN